jgi:(1->4)-alpha-D-glucan 1-alpha-D-glucosylmutase
MERALERRPGMTPPRATYRLQLRAGFGFKETAALAPYLAALGVGHVYLSPFFKARPGSSHGYDITDHRQLNPELGTEADYRAMIEALDRAGLARLLDIVPNHMGVGGADNPLWLDVLEWGQESAYAGWFDIDWQAGRGKLLAPVLGAQYGEALQASALALKFDDSGFAVWAYDAHKLPLCPLTYPLALGSEHPALDRMADLFEDLPNWQPQVAVRALGLKRELAALARQPPVRRALDARLARFNGDPRALAELIAAQRWRVAYFRVAEDEINYRRFFNINDLAGLRMELGPVFDHAHERVFGMLESGEIQGLRIDHIDGLFDPKAYLTVLREKFPRPFYLVVEKILAVHEALPADWPIEGTTGYDYLNLSLGLLVDPAAKAALDETYRNFAGAADDFEMVARTCKLRIMDNEMASECGALSRAAARLARRSPMTADLTRALLQRAIKQVVAALPVYRAYLDFDGRASDADRRDVTTAVARARREDPEVDDSAFDFLENAMLAETAKPPTQELSPTAALRVAMRLQQFSGPVMAKGVEDTAFYRYNRFLALNEVSGAPDRFGLAPAQFHAANAARAASWPNTMLATATHDTKRGEDARARLAVISELPDEWRREVGAWSQLLRARMGDPEASAAPDRQDEYMLYQMLTGAWPADMPEAPSAEALAAFGERLSGAIDKALREAKRRSTWSAPNRDYEAATQAFAREALKPGDDAFLASFLPFVRRLARLGVDNSLVQTALKLTAPGVPDIYQGCELWDFSLVDPDNRRPVDYAARSRALEAMTAELGAARNRMALFGSLLGDWRDGRVKLALTAALLNLRRERAALFAEGDYQPLRVVGEAADWVVAFMRTLGAQKAAVIVARFPAHRAAAPDWRASVELPPGAWREVLGRPPYESGAPLGDWLGKMPIAVLYA